VATFFYTGGTGGGEPDPSGTTSSVSTLPPDGGPERPPEEGTGALSPTTPTYDANGNLKTYNGWTYTYDAQNRLTSANGNGHSATFRYDGKNRQIARWIDGAIRYSVWDDWELIEEYADSSSRSAAYLQGAHGVIRALVDGSYYYYYQDTLGSTTHLANAAGQLVESYRYDLYGTPSYFNSTAQPLNSSTYGIVDLYAGERWISELGLYDLRNRFMSPELGRFIQADPIGFKGDGSNLYRYCGNDPVDRSDPTGLIATDWTWSHLMWEQGNSPYGFNDLYTAYVNQNQPAGNEGAKGLTMAGQYRSDTASGNANDVTINQLKTQLGGKKDQTTQGVPTNGGLQIVEGGTEVRKPRGGRASGTFGYTGKQEQINLRKDADRLIHAHTLEGKRYALPTPDDDDAVQHARGRSMYFTSRYLARHGASPDGQKGNYIIYHYTGSRSWDQPQPEFRFDPRLTLPPLPGY
jgi:RHS repeat-associated protein